MKRLIVLTALLTLLGSTLGCGILRAPRAQSCNSPPPLPSLGERIRARSFSLPLRRTNDNLNAAPCTTCGPATNSGTIVTAPMVSESLYQPDVIYQGPTVYTERPVYESVPAPATAISPELGLHQ